MLIEWPRIQERKRSNVNFLRCFTTINRKYDQENLFILSKSEITSRNVCLGLDKEKIILLNIVAWIFHVFTNKWLLLF